MATICLHQGSAIQSSNSLKHILLGNIGDYPMDHISNFQIQNILFHIVWVLNNTNSLYCMLPNILLVTCIHSSTLLKLVKDGIISIGFDMYSLLNIQVFLRILLLLLFMLLGAAGEDGNHYTMLLPKVSLTF